MKRAFTGLVVFFAPLLLTPAFASVISLSTTVTAGVESNELWVLVSSVNHGDEPAYNVQAEIQVSDRAAAGERINRVPVNGAYGAEFRVPLGMKIPGAYPLVLTMHYTDVNRYPFSALAVQSFVYGRDAAPPVAGQAGELVCWKDGIFRFSLKNLGDHAIRTTTRLIVPRELTVAEVFRELSLVPKKEEGSSFTVRNVSALRGSVYQVYAVFQFEDGGLHYTGIVPGTIKLTEPPKLFGLSRREVIAILIVLAAAFAIAQFVRRK